MEEYLVPLGNDFIIYRTEHNLYDSLFSTAPL